MTSHNLFHNFKVFITFPYIFIFMKHVSKLLYILQNVKSQKMLINVNIIKRVKK